MFNQFGLPEMLLIAFVAILFFGREKLVDLAKSTGEAMKEFKGALKDDEKEIIKDVVKKTKSKK
jgi:sec-independent protein translocase protein TatA